MAAPKPVTPRELLPSSPAQTMLELHIAPMAEQSYNYVDGLAIDSVLLYENSYGFAWWTPLELDFLAPVGVRTSESASDALFIEASIASQHLNVLELAIGDDREVDDELNPTLPLYLGTVSKKDYGDEYPEYSYETIIRRLARNYPEGILVVANDVPDMATEVQPEDIPDADPADWDNDVQYAFTPRQALLYILETWKAENEWTWLEWEVIPEILLRDGSLVYIRALSLPQVGLRREWRSAFAWLEQFFGIFDGYVFRASVENALQVNAPNNLVGEGPTLALLNEDILPYPRPTEDISGIFNAAIVASQGYEFQDEQEIAAAAQFRIRHSRVAESLEGDEGRQEIGGSPLVRTTDGSERARIEVLLPFAEGLLVGQGDVELGVVVAWGTAAGDGIRGEDTYDVQVTGQWQQLVAKGSGTGPLYTMSARRVSEGILMRWEIQLRRRRFSVFYYALRILFNVVGRAWQQSNVAITGEWVDEGFSYQKFGRIEKSFRSEVFALSPEQCLDVAKAKVEANSNPRLIFDIEQSWAGRYKVRPSMLGKSILLPDGELAVFRSHNYSEVQAFATSASSSDIELVLEQNLNAVYVAPASATDIADGQATSTFTYYVDIGSES